MWRLRLVPDNTRIDFMGWRRAAFAFTLVVSVVSITSLGLRGLNLGLDFEGGLVVEARTSAPIDTGALRARLSALKLGDLSLQTFGDDREIMIRVHQLPGDPAAPKRTFQTIRDVLGPAYEIRRTDFIGPEVSGELLADGILASALAIALIAVYVWFRFEWQFGVAALLTTLHDVVATFGLFTVLQLEFDLKVVAAILTIAGYSINDTVVVFDRIRENLRRYKKMDLPVLINLSVNQTLTRTVLTSGTTMLVVLALLFFGGPVLRNFSAALAWGIVVGTYSSVFVASALLLYMPMPGMVEADDTDALPGESTPRAPTGATG